LVRLYLVVLGLFAVACVGCGGSSETDPVPGSKAESRRQTAPLGSGANGDAREKGRQACRGMTPREAANHFEAAARRAGVNKRFAKLVTEPTPEVEASSGYPRLAAALYAMTTPEKDRAAAASGCAEELAAP